MDHHGHIHKCYCYQFDTGPDTWNTDHMMGFIIAVVYFALVLLAIGTVCAVISAWRQGVLGRDINAIKSGLGGLYLRFKKFAQQKNKD